MDCFTVTVKFEKNYNLFNLKFSCMKKKLIFAGAVVLMAAAAVTAYMANYRPDPFDLLNANIEVLAQDESLDPGESGNQGIVCQFKSKVKPGCTYYDCGPCIKVYNEEDRGNYSKCFR